MTAISGAFQIGMQQALKIRAGSLPRRGQGIGVGELPIKGAGMLVGNGEKNPRRIPINAGVHVKAVATSRNTAFLPTSRSCFKHRYILMLNSLTTVWRFCVNFWVIFGNFGKESRLEKIFFRWVLIACR